MYESDPHQINKTKISLLIILSLLLAAVLFYLHFYNITIPISFFQSMMMEYLGYFLQLGVIIFCFKTYLLKKTRDYLYIGTAALLVTLFQLFNRYFISFFTLDSAIVNSLASLNFELLILSIFLLLASFNAGKAVALRRRTIHFISILFISLLLFAIIICIPIYFIKHVVEISLPINIIVGFILLWATFKFIKLYYQTGYNIYFWFITAVIFLFFSGLYFIFIKVPNDIFFLISEICFLLALFSLIWVTYEEHTRFMDSEIDLRKSLEKSLLQVEKNFATYSNLIDNIDVGIFVVDDGGVITFANARFSQMVGIQIEQLIGRNQSQLFDEANLEKFLIEREKWISGSPSQFEVEISTSRGKTIPVLISTVPIKDKLGRFQGSRQVVLEFRARKEFEQKIKDYSAELEKKVQERTEDLHKKSEEWKRAKKYYETLISGMLDILLVVNKQGNCIFINDYGRKLLGYEANELKRRMLPTFFADMKNLQQNYGDAMKVELRDYEAEVKTKSGKHILCSWNVRYLYDHNGKHIGAMCVGRDISEYKAMQKKLEAYSKNLEQEVVQRTKELNLKINQLSNILKIGEDIILNIKLSEILSNICDTIKNLGWKIVIIALKQEDVLYSKIGSISGIPKNRLRKLMSDRESLFKNPLKFLEDENRIGNSYYVSISGSNLITKRIDRKEKSNQLWRHGDVLLTPVKIKNRILGFIMVFEPEDGLIPDAEKTQILEIFAQKAAVAIENDRLFKEIEMKASDAENISRTKSEFFANMSHELRTPLNSILTLTSILLQQMSGELNTEQMRQISIVKRNGERLLKLINDILDLSKIEAGGMEVNYTYFPVIDLIRANLETVRPMAQKKRLKLELKIDRNVPPYIFNDQDKIDHVLTNVLSNAVKFTERGKITVTISCGDKGKLLNIEVKDTGVGIDKNDLENIFLPFRQSENQDRLKKKGTGLGLSISRQLWQILGGNIIVESKKEHGTTFRLVLPLKEIGEKEKIKMISKEATSQTSTDHNMISKRSNGKKRILLVDDNLDNHYAVKFILEDKGYSVLFARNGADGVKIAIKEKPALILMDMMMPGIDGYQATKKIRGNEGMKNIPIVAMTAKTKAEDRGKALAVGCSDYLSKPFTMDDIINKVHQWIGAA